MFVLANSDARPLFKLASSCLNIRTLMLRGCIYGMRRSTSMTRRCYIYAQPSLTLGLCAGFAFWLTIYFGGRNVRSPAADLFFLREASIVSYYDTASQNEQPFMETGGKPGIWQWRVCCAFI